jgi:hypothetical protein
MANTIGENFDGEENKNQVIDNDEHNQHLIDVHGQFLRPEEMQELQRLLHWRNRFRYGGGGGGGGGLTDAEHEIIQNMVAYRGNMKRTVSPIQDNNGKVVGSECITTSDDPTTAKTIQDHVLGMQKLVQAGRVARQWDPL